MELKASSVMCAATSRLTPAARQIRNPKSEIGYPRGDTCGLVSVQTSNPSPQSSQPMSILKTADPALWDAIQHETTRQHDGLELIASENYTSAAVLEAAGTVLT